MLRLETGSIGLDDLLVVKGRVFDDALLGVAIDVDEAEAFEVVLLAKLPVVEQRPVEVAGDGDTFECGRA